MKKKILQKIIHYTNVNYCINVSMLKKLFYKDLKVGKEKKRIIEC